MTFFILLPIYITAFLFGLVIGSFLNVLIYRIPKHENIVVKRSHCMNCGYQLAWYDLIPVFSWLGLKGRCRKCKEKISVQYPLIEALNGVLYVLVFAVRGVNIDSLLICLLSSMLVTLSVIDFRTFEIPLGINITILVLGLIRMALDYSNWLDHVIGLFSVSVFLWLIYQFSKGRAIGGGDVKLMGAAGLFMGWKLTLLSLALGCVLGALIHVLRMKLSGKDHVLAMGPYLAAGIFISVLWGERLIGWYLGICGL